MQEQQKQELARQELKKCLRRALEGDEQKLLRAWLHQMVLAASYAPGREIDKVAWLEGKRALAAFILKEGGVYE